MKKIVSLLVAMAMLFCIIPSAFASALPFTDVPSDAWYASYVDYAYSHKFMSGTSDTTFAPNTTMTRGMLVTVLHSVAGKPQHSGNNPFSDVGDSWYRNAVIWCYENKIVAGTSATTFSPNSTVTRDQMVAIMFKYAAACGLDTTARADISSYSDYGNIESYAKDAFSWSVANNIISGTSKTTLSPKDGGTRAQYAVILQRFDEFSKTPTEPDASTPTEPGMTNEQKNALEQADQYLAFTNFSHDGLVEQLEYEGYSHDVAVFAADNCGADWNAQAVNTAKGYLEISAFSYEGLYDQLIFEKFTEEQARHGVDNCEADWNEQAVKKAASYLELMPFSRDKLIGQLEYEGFTHEQAVHGVTQNGL